MSLLRPSYLDRFLLRARRDPAVPTLPDLNNEASIPASQTCILQWTDADGSQAAGKAEIGCRAANGLAVKFGTPLRAGTEVGVFGDVPGRTVVTFCRPEGNGYALILAPVTRHRRRSDREPASGVAVLHWRTPDGVERADTVEIRNLTTEGMQIAAKHPVPVPSLVRVAGEEVGCLGSTCYCWRVDDEFLIGLQFVQAPYLQNSPDYDEDS